ncbi:MAG TPA: AAA family ATPase, partial [bacterium]|nr:AAA family ATPase [bacterium]
MPPLTLRIFVSSPGDVAEERVIAQRVIERLQREYAGHLTLEPILWEHEPLLATYGWQHQIPLPHDCDIVICILWSRLGTRLPGDITRPDGSRYESGTAYEFEDALEGFHQRGKPDLVVYRKMAPPTLNLEHVEEVLHRLEQKQALDTFIDKWFSDTEEGVSKTPYHPFTNSSQFEELVLKHLRKLCDRHLARAAGEGNGGVEPVLPSRVVWTQGSPFRGLEVFEPEHAEIFCGRTRAVGEVLQALRRQIAQGRAFVLVVGASGAGKSSLVRAGVLPLLIQPGVMEGVGLWRWAIFKPSDSGGDLIEALASALLRPEALPELATDGTGVPELAAMLRSTPQAAAALVKGALSQAAASKQTQDRLDHQPEARLVLVVDQMEEIFTRERILPEHRLAFVEIVASLAKGGRACILATLRSDLYPRTQDIPPLLELKAGDGLYDLVPPLAAEIGQMIREPAHAAGLTFEVHPKTGVALDDLLLNASVTHPGNLPLLEFTLAALYERRTPAGLLTHQAYEELGGLEGAIAHRAEETFRVLKPETQAAFGRIFRHLVSLGSGEEETIARQPATMADLVHTPQGREFVERFVEARLFTSGQGDDGVPVVTIAHEALLRHWPRLQGWLEEDRELLRIKSRVQAAAGRWAAEGRPGDLLLPAGKLLDEARVLQHADSGLGEVELAFLRSSVVRAEHQRRTKQLGVVMLAVFGLLSALLAVFAFRANTQTRVALGQAEQQRHETERERLLGLAREGILYADQGRARTARDRLVEAATGLTPDGHLPDWLTVAFWDLFRRQPLPLFEKVGGRTSWNIGLSPDGRRALTISADQTQAQLWDTISGQVLRTFTATSPLDSATLSPDGTLAVASAEDSTVYVWDAATGEQRWSFKEGDATLLDMSFSHDGRYLLGGGVDEVAWLWDLETGALERRYPTPGYALYAVALSPDGRWVATGVNQAVDGLTLWNRAAAKPVAHLQGHGAGVFGINFTPDSRRLVSSSYDRTVRVWSVPGAAPVRTIEAHVHSVDQVRVLHDGRRALSLGRDGTIKLWDLETGALQRTWTGDPAAFFVFAVDATATHMVTVGHGGHMQLWGLGAEPSTLDLRRNSPEVALTHAHADPAGRWVVAVYDDGLVELRDVATGYLLKRYPSMGFRPMRTALDHAGRRLAVLSTEAVLKIIDIGTGTVAGPYEVGLGDRDICRPQGAAFTPD